MIVRRPLPGERNLLFSPIGLRLIDDFTGDAPFGPIRAFLDRQDANGTWYETSVKAVVTPSGNITYPGLERRADPHGPTHHYRCRIEADFYVPVYRALQDAIEFDAFPYNDTNQPANFPPPPNLPLPQDVMLAPGSNYPYPGHIHVLRGRTLDVNGRTVADAIVRQGIQEQVLTDNRGVFAIPLRWVQTNVAVPIDADHPRSNTVGTINVTIPQDLGQNHDIQLI